MDTTTRSGIPTNYRSTIFRSRLEAKWAAFFDLVGWRWVYEPFDTGNWIPDFLVTGASSFLVEVGPCETLADYESKAAKPRVAYPPYEELVGPPGDQMRVRRVAKRTLVAGLTPALKPDGWRGTAAGCWAISQYPGIEELGDLEPAFWWRCPICDTLAIDQGWPDGLAPCGHYEDLQQKDWVSTAEIEDLWGEASNAAQWHP